METYRSNELEQCIFIVKDALKKAWYVSNLGADYFDLRDEEVLSVTERDTLLLGYAGAALEHDMVHDYVTRALEQMNTLEENLYAPGDGRRCS